MYYRYNENNEFIGITGVEPNNNLWTITPYAEAFYKPKFENGVWIEGASEQELINYQKSLIPQEITPRQFKLALALNGTTPEMIEGFINTMEEPTRTLAMINWKDATTFKRSNEMINSFAPLLGLTQEQLDALFALGATFE